MSIRVYDAAKVYLDDLLLPITPDKLTVKNENQNESTQSVDGTPITIPKKDKAQTFTLSFIIPFITINSALTFTDAGTRNVRAWTDYLWTLKVDRKPFILTINYSDNSHLNGSFLLDDYEYTQDGSQGSDYTFSLTITEYYPAYNAEIDVNLRNSLIEHGIRNPRRLD